MPTNGGQAGGDARANRAALTEVLAQVPDEDRAEIPDRTAHRILSIGLRLGLDDPGAARNLLELIEAEAAGDQGGQPGASGPIPLPSMLLARTAAMADADLATEDAPPRFGWAARLSRGELLSIGRVVGEMLDRGVAQDVARGFGLAWDAGVSLPRKERDGLFAQFADLETTIARVLDGQDMPADRGSPPTGLGGLFVSWFSRPRLGDARASAAIERGGDPARRGLVAVWNVWPPCASGT